MPNWCENVLTVRAENRDRLLEVLSEIGHEKSPLDFAAIIPEPDTETYRESQVGPGAFPEWYEWRVANWGTKWNAGDVEMSESEAQAVFTFNTAWSPPVPVIEQLAEKYPDLIVSLAYDEPGMDFGGYTVMRGDEQLAGGEGGSRITTWADAADNELDYLLYLDDKAKREAVS